MTRIGGTDIVSAPCCGRHYTTPLYSSINFTASEYWTDGAASGSLAPAGGGLHQCACGSYFLMSDTVLVRRIFKSREPAQEPVPLHTRLIRRWLPFLEKNPPTAVPVAELPPEPPEELPPRPDGVDDEDLPKVIAACGDNQTMEIVARRRYWQALNNPYRAVYRAHKDTGVKDFPPFAPTDEQRLNMAALLGLLLYRPGNHAVEITELYREMGDLVAAKRAFAGVPPSNGVVKVIGECLNHGLTGPVRFRGW